MFEHFDDGARRAIILAIEEARMLNRKEVDFEHILLGLLAEREGVAARALESLGISLQDARLKIQESHGRGSAQPSDDISFYSLAKEMLGDKVPKAAKELGCSHIGTEHLLLGLIDHHIGKRELVDIGVNLNCARVRVLELKYQQDSDGLPPPAETLPSPHSLLLAEFGQNLGQAAYDGLLDQPIDRQNEMHAITQIMTRESKNHPLLVSNRGVGASSLIYGIACSIAEGSVPELNCAHTYRIDITDLLGCPPDYYDKRNFNRGLAELLVGIPSPENIVIAIDSAFRPPGALGEAIWPINLLQRVLTCGKHRVIATATPSEYSQYLSQDGTVASFFEAIEVDELDASYAVEILKSVRKRYEARHQAVITDEAISAAVALSIRHMPERPLPGKALDLLDAAATRAAQRVFGQNLPSFNELENEIARLVSAKHAAIDNAEFDQAAAIRSAEADLRIALARKREGWATSAASLTTEVSGKDIAETVAALTATKSGPDITV